MSDARAVAALADPNPADPASANDIGSVRKGLDALQQKREKLTQQEQQEMAPAIGRAQTALASPKPAAPQLQKQPEAPKIGNPEDIQTFFVAATLLAGIAGAATRNHVTNALNAFGAAVKGYKEGRLADAEEQYKQWHAASDEAIKNNEAMMAEYQAATESRKSDLAEAMGEVQLTAIKYKDPIMAQAAAEQNFTLVAQLQEQQRNADRQYGIAVRQLDQAHEQMINTLKEKTNNINTPEGMAAYLEKRNSMTPEMQQQMDKLLETLHPKLSIEAAKTEAEKAGIEDTAKMISGYQMAPLSGWAMKSPSGQAIMARVRQLNPEYDATQFTMKNRAVQAFASGPQGNQVRSINVSVQHLDTYRDLAAALKNGSQQDINRVSQSWAERFGSPAPTNFDAAKQIIGQEVVKAVVAGGGGVTERNQAQEAFDRAKSPAQLEGAINTIETLMAGQLKGLKRQYESSTLLHNFDEAWLDPETREVLGRVGSAAKPSTAAPAASTPGTPDAGGWKIEKVE